MRLVVLLHHGTYKTKDKACQEQVDYAKWQRHIERWVSERRRTVILTKGDAAAMNSLLHPPGDTCWLTQSRKEWDSWAWKHIHKRIQTNVFTFSSQQVETCAVSARMPLAFIWVSGRCRHIDQNVFPFSTEFKSPSVEGLVTPSGNKAYCTQC